MLNSKFKFTYRECIIIGTPLKKEMNISIYDMGVRKIYSTYIRDSENIKMHQLLGFCRGYIDRHIEKVESIGNVK